MGDSCLQQTLFASTTQPIKQTQIIKPNKKATRGRLLHPSSMIFQIKVQGGELKKRLKLLNPEETTRLMGPKLGIDTASGNQLLMGSLFDDTTLIEHD